MPFTLANCGDRVWYAEGGTPENIDYRTAIITGFVGDPADGVARLAVYQWDGSGVYGIEAPYAATPAIGSWSAMDDVTF